MMKLAALVLLLALGMAAHAAPTLSIEPANPTPADTIVVTLRDSVPTCPSPAPELTNFAAPNQIRMMFSRVAGCSFGQVSEAKAAIGRLPAGNYTVIVMDAFPDMSPPPTYTVQLTVSLPVGTGGPNAVAPLENFAGHYLTGQDGEGVFIEQYGDKTFLTFATYDAQGLPTWFVVPEARWRYNTARSRFEFAGLMYRARRGQESPPSLTVTSIGSAVWYPTGFDTAVLETPIDGASSRTLRRFRF
jgi:hypothetical protein